MWGASFIQGSGTVAGLELRARHGGILELRLGIAVCLQHPLSNQVAQAQ